MLLIEEIEETSDVYDITVEDTHNFYADGILVHNCTEIMQHTRSFRTVNDEEGRIALCTISSTNWGSARHPEDLRRPTRLLVRGLHNLLQYQDFLSIHSEMHNKEFEPLGIGITNLAYWHAKRKMKYGEEEALAEIKRWMEHQSFYAIEASVELAEEKGPCTMSDKTWYGKGVFPWERRSKGVDELTDFTPAAELDWETLRARMMVSGIRNATLGAIAPVESSSVVLNSTNGIEMVKQLITIKDSKAGAFAQVVPEYKKLKKYYQLLWDQPDCIEYLKTVAVLQVYIDQGISSNTFYSPKYFEGGKIPTTLVMKNLMIAHIWGIKSHYYHLVDKHGAMESLKDSNEGANVVGMQIPVPIQVTPTAAVTLATVGAGIYKPIVSTRVIEAADEDDCESCKL